jgi:CheY-like chemotaxis protein
MQWRDEKYRVLVTMDGEECLNIYHEGLERARSGKQYTGSKTQPFDAVILDNKMPKANGLEVD